MPKRLDYRCFNYIETDSSYTLYGVVRSWYSKSNLKRNSKRLEKRGFFSGSFLVFSLKPIADRCSLLPVDEA